MRPLPFATILVISMVVDAGVEGIASMKYSFVVDSVEDFRPLPREALLVGSHKSYVYHLPTCEWAEEIKYSRYFLDFEEAEQCGYRSCRVCYAQLFLHLFKDVSLRNKSQPPEHAEVLFQGPLWEVLSRWSTRTENLRNLCWVLSQIRQHSQGQFLSIAPSGRLYCMRGSGTQSRTKCLDKTCLCASQGLTITQSFQVEKN